MQVGGTTWKRTEANQRSGNPRRLSRSPCQRFRAEFATTSLQLQGNALTHNALTTYSLRSDVARCRNVPTSSSLSSGATRAQRGFNSMPVLGYCLWVGSVLLALMFAADVYLPEQPPREAHLTYRIPIASKPNKSPSLTFSGETRNFGPPPPMSVVDLAAQSSQPKPTDVRTQAHAQLTDAPPSANSKAKPARKKVAKRRINRQDDFARMPEAWRQDRNVGFAYARPFFW